MTNSTAGLLTTKKGAVFSCSRPDGDMSGLGAEGLWLNDARHLSRLILRLSGLRPRLESNSDAPGNEATVRLRHTEFVRVVRHRSIERSFVERITVSNDGPSRKQTVQVELDCDLTDMFVVRGLAVDELEPPAPKLSEGHIRYERVGRDGLRRTTDVTASPPPTRVAEKGSSHVLEWDLALTEGGRRVIVLDVGCAPQDEPLVSPQIDFEPPRDPCLALALAAASRDLAMLQTPIEGHGVPAAGIPYYVALFGRDSLLTALALLDAAPAIARATLFALAEHQATANDPERDAEPGKILHELRRGEVARSGELPFCPYYGSVDATPLFVLLAAEYGLRTGDARTFDALETHVVAALRWVDEFGDLDGDGFVEYQRRSSRGLINQGWKDSPDAIVNADGTPAKGPIALCEVQGYVYAAKTKLADLLETRGRSSEATRLRSEAAGLRSSFRRDFWMEAGDCYALALDGDKKQVASVTSNAGHCLWSGITEPDLAPRLSHRLLAPDMFSGWGIRTLSETSPAFDAGSYHRGSVWPHDNALIACGLADYALLEPALRIREALLDVATANPAYRLPELLCGFERVEGEPYETYPTTCVPQAWAAASIFLLASLPNR